MADEKEEIRELDGVKYKIVKVKCDCMCHKYPEGTIKHVMACCHNGYKQHLVKIKNK